MTDDLARDGAFWKLIAALEAAGVLEHVMIIGTWAEWLYSDYFVANAGGGDYRVDIGKTHDIDVYFRNYLMEIDGASRLKDDLRDAGFTSTGQMQSGGFPAPLGKKKQRLVRARLNQAR